MVSEPSDIFIASTAVLSFVAMAYSLFSMNKDKGNANDSIFGDGMYQCWSGLYNSSDLTLYITIVREKMSSIEKNLKWIQWNGSTDASVVSRDFYLGNADPSFSWSYEQREFDTKCSVRETMTDGWDSLIQMKITATVKNIPEEGMNEWLKEVLLAKKIHWQKTLISKEEFTSMFG